MIRRIVVIDEEKCSGCGKCAEACHENAIGMIDGKARLLRDDYCDGLGDCLPACPAGAISFVEREAVPYDEAAVRENQPIQSDPPRASPGLRSYNTRSDGRNKPLPSENAKLSSKRCPRHNPQDQK